MGEIKMLIVVCSKCRCVLPQCKCKETIVEKIRFNPNKKI